MITLRRASTVVIVVDAVGPQADLHGAVVREQRLGLGGVLP